MEPFFLLLLLPYPTRPTGLYVLTAVSCFVSLLCLLFSTHSASRFIFLKHTSDDVIFLLRSFNLLPSRVPLLSRGEPFTGSSQSPSVLGLPRQPPPPRQSPGGPPCCAGTKSSISLLWAFAPTFPLDVRLFPPLLPPEISFTQLRCLLLHKVLPHLPAGRSSPSCPS